MLTFIQTNPRGATRACVIWLHGLGADGHDFEPIVPELGLTAEQGVKFLFPHAPHRPVTINGGYVMRAWYDIVSEDFGHAVDEAGILESERQVAALVEEEVQRGTPPSRIILAGFSQGGVIALGVAAKFRPTLGGVIALSCYVPLPHHLSLADGALPVFMGHGREDAIVPYGLGEKGRELLREKGYRVQWHEYSMPHAVCADEVRDIARWLRERLATMDPAA